MLLNVLDLSLGLAFSLWLPHEYDFGLFWKRAFIYSFHKFLLASGVVKYTPKYVYFFPLV